MRVLWRKRAHSETGMSQTPASPPRLTATLANGLLSSARHQRAVMDLNIGISCLSTSRGFLVERKEAGSNRERRSSCLRIAQNHPQRKGGRE